MDIRSGFNQSAFRRFPKFAVTLLGLIGSTVGYDSWLSYTGGGSFLPAQGGYDYVDSTNEIELLWNGPEHMGVPKGKSSAYVLDEQIEAALAAGFEAAFPGGSCSPIVAEGKVFVCWFMGSGETLMANESPNQGDFPLSDTITRRILADDICMAIDAQTGEELWRQAQPGGVNRGGKKRGHFGVTPVYHNGVVYTMGTTGRLFAYNAENGDLVWQSEVPSLVQRMEAEKQKALEERYLVEEGWKISLTVAGDVLVAPMYDRSPDGGLQGFSLDDGSLLWTLEEVVCRWTTPTTWRHDGKEYLLTPTESSGKMRLIDPAAGEVVWTHQVGPNIASIVTHADYAILNSISDPDGIGDGLYGCYRISLDGPELLWQLPEDIDFMHAWDVSDNSNHRWVAIRDSIAVVIIRPAHQSDWEKHDCRLLVLRTEDGQILYDHRMNQGNGPEMKSQRIRLPYLLDNRLVLMTDMNHGASGYGGYYYKVENDGKLTYKGELPILHHALTSYETPIEIPCADGRMYFRSISGIACYDFLSGETSISGSAGVGPAAQRTNSVWLRDNALIIRTNSLRNAGNRIRISNMLGRIVFEQTVALPRNGTEKRIMLPNHLSRGNYFIHVDGMQKVQSILLR